MQAYMVFFREDLPLRQLKVMLIEEGYDQIQLDHAGNSMVIETEQYSSELTVKLEHLIKQSTDLTGCIVVRPKVRLERLLSQNPFQGSHCPANRIRYILFQRTPPLERLTNYMTRRGYDPNRVAVSQEGAYFCLMADRDLIEVDLDALENDLQTPVLVRSHDAIERAIKMVGEHETRLEKTLFESGGI